MIVLIVIVILLFCLVMAFPAAREVLGYIFVSCVVGGVIAIIILGLVIAMGRPDTPDTPTPQPATSAEAAGPSQPMALAEPPPAAAAIASADRSAAPPISEKSRASSIGPGFDCAKAAQPLAQLICANPELSKTDLRFNQAYYALRQQLDAAGQRQLREDDLEFLDSVRRFCGVPGSPGCVAAQYDRKREEWLSRLNGPAREEATRPIERHVALQTDLQRLGFLPASAKIDGVYSVATRSAIVAWQKAGGRPATGFIGEGDAAALASTAPPLRVYATETPIQAAPITPLVPALGPQRAVSASPSQPAEQMPIASDNPAAPSKPIHLPRPRPLITTDPPPPAHFGHPLTTTGAPPDTATAALINHWATAYYWIDAPRTGCLAGGPEHDPCDRARRAAQAAADQDVVELRQRGWCHVYAHATNWYHCAALPDEQLAVAQFTPEEQQSYTQSFIRAATQFVRSAGPDSALAIASNTDLFARCRDPVVEGDNCALTVAQRKDLFQQIVTYYQSLGPHYTLH